MPELAEQNTFRQRILEFIEKIGSQSGPEALQVEAIYTDVKDTELKDMALRERRLLEHASTLSGVFIEQSFHTVWAITLGRIAASIPDTHGLMICKVLFFHFSFLLCKLTTIQGQSQVPGVHSEATITQLYFMARFL
jgi:hypothetical protein